MSDSRGLNNVFHTASVFGQTTTIGAYEFPRPSSRRREVFFPAEKAHSTGLPVLWLLATYITLMTVIGVPLDLTKSRLGIDKEGMVEVS